MDGTGEEIKHPVDPPPTPELPSTDYDISSLGYADQFNAQPLEVKLNDQGSNELSGIAASQLNSGLYYMHNDSDQSAIIVNNAKGELVARLILDGVKISDPEDISVAPGPIKGKSYIYYAGIGDNNKTKSTISVFRLEEPDLSTVAAGSTLHISQVEELKLAYPQLPYNAETLLVDPLTLDMYIATKEVNRSTIFKASYPQSTTEVNNLTPVLLMRFFDLFTSGDISADGKGILLRNKSQIWYWERDPAQSVEKTLTLAPKMAPYAGNEHQGEGISFMADAKGYVTNTETRDYPGAVSMLSFYQYTTRLEGGWLVINVG